MFKKKNKTEEAAKTKNTAQASIPIKEIYSNGLVKSGEKTYSMLFRLDTTAYLSQTEDEQRSMYERYCSMLVGLSPNITYQELVFSKPVNQDRLNALIIPNAENKNDYIEAFCEGRKAFAEKISVDITEKEYIIALSYTVTSKLDNPFSALNKAAVSINGKLSGFGSGITALMPDEIYSLFFRLYNPYSSLSYQHPCKGSPFDAIAPGDINFKAKGIELGQAKIKLFHAFSFGSTLDDTFLTDLLQNNCRVYVSKHILHIPKDAAVSSVERRLKSLEADRQDRLKKNKQSGENYIPVELERNINSCVDLINKLHSTEELFELGVIVAVCGETDAELSEACTLIINKAAEHYVSLKPLIFRQEEGWKAIMPLAVSEGTAKTLMLSSEAAVMTPFSYPTFLDENGIFYGINIKNGEPVIIDRRKDKNSNGFIFGKSGGGKSFYAKLEISALLADESFGDIVVLDPDGEFAKLAELNGGEVIRLASQSDVVINPFDVSRYELEKNGEAAVMHKVHYIIAFINALKGSSLTAIEKTLIDRAATAVYRDYLDGKSDMPTLISFDEKLAAYSEGEAHTVRLYLERYVKGSISLFTGQSTKTTDKRFTVYDLTKLGSELKDTGMLAVITAVWNKVYENNAKGKWTWIYLDELHRYYRDEDGLAAYQIERLYAEIRKNGGIVTSMTQHPKGVLSNASASSMLANSQFLALFEQNSENVDIMVEHLHLNDEQKKLLLASDTGAAVLRSRNSTVAVQLKWEKGNVVYDTLTTNFKDKVAAE